MTKFTNGIKKVMATLLLFVILSTTTGITNIVHAADYLILKGTVITGANYNQPLDSFYQESVAIGTTKTTGVTQTWSVGTGMHEFSYDRRTLNPVIPISKWVAIQFENENNSQGTCVHGWIDEWRVGDNYFTWGTSICGRRTIPAWSAYCADCGQSVVGETYIYLNSNYVANITSIDCSEDSAIASGCIFCGSEEQATTVPSHTCKGASYNRYYVSYNGNGATGGSTGTTTHMYENATTYDGVEISRSTSLARNGYTRTGYVFTGWNTRADGTGTSYTNGQEIKNLTATDGDTITLYAQWVKDNFNLTVNPNSGTWNGSTQTQTFNIAYQGTKVIPVPTKIGYEFTGWTLVGNGSTMTSLTGEATFTMGAGDATLTANWKPIQYQVTYDGNGATSGSTATSTHTYDEDKNLTTNGYERSYRVTYNYNGSGQESTQETATANFNGWATSSSGAVSFQNNQVVRNLRTTSGTYNLYANWTLGSVTLPSATRTGYNALGWSENQSATTATYDIGQRYTPAADTTLYMVWEPYTLKVNLEVQDEETKEQIANSAVWEIQEWNNQTQTYERKAILERKLDGTYETADYLTYSDQNEGKFRLVEQTAPDGYYGDWVDETQTNKNTYDINILMIIQNQNYEGQSVQDKGTISMVKENQRQKAQIEVTLVDKETKGEAQADATLEGAIFGIYAKEDIVHGDGVTGILYHAGDLVQRQTIQNQKLTFQNLELGSYEIKEISSSEGYVLNEEAYPIVTAYQGEEKQVVTYEQTVEQQVKKQAFQLLKVGGLENDAEYHPLEGAGFKIYLISSLRGVREGEITADQNGNYNIEDFKNYDFSQDTTALDYTNSEEGTPIEEIFSGEDGVVVSTELAYGKYVVVETTIPENHLKVDPFFVNVTEDNRTPQDLGSILDEDFTAKLRIVKKDNTSKQTVLKANAKYRILNVNTKEYVTQEVDGVILGTEENPFVTDETGSITTPLTIRYGEYELQEIAAPEGYVLVGKEGVSKEGVYTPMPKQNVKFILSENTVQEIDQSTGEVMLVVEQYNQRQLGSIKIQVQGEYLEEVNTIENGVEVQYEKRGIPNTIFELYAKKDIESPDGQGEILYQKDEKIATITSDESGICYIDNLLLGEYYIKQTEAGEGFVLNTEQKDISLPYVGDKEAISYAEVSYENERQKIHIVLENKDSQTQENIQGGTFGIYTQEEISYQTSTGETIVIPADTLMSVQTVTEEGKIEWSPTQNIDLPLGNYQIKQIKAPDGYASSEEVIVVEGNYQGQDIATIERKVTFENDITKLRIQLQDRETEQGLAEATLRIVNEEGQTIYSWTTDQTGEVLYKGLIYGNNYTLEVVTPRVGYEKTLYSQNHAGDISHEQNEQGNIVFSIQDSMEEQTLIVANLAKVGSIQIEKQGEVLIEAEEEENGNLQFQYETQSLPNASFEIYANEVIEHPDGHTGLLFAEGTKIAEGTTTENGLTITNVSDNVKQIYIEQVQQLLERGLPLGSYRIVEIKAPEGYYRNPVDCEQIVTLEDIEDSNYIEETSIFENARQTVTVKVHKYDAETTQSLEGVTIGLYAQNDILENGQVIVTGGTLIQKQVTDEEGIAIFEGNIPLGNYYVQEIEAADGYVLASEQIQIQAETLEENRRMIEANVEFANQKTKIQIIKTTQEGEAIIGANLQIVDENNNLMDSWITDGTNHEVEGLETEKTYILQEVEPAKGFVTAEDISFHLDKEGKVQETNYLYAENVIQMKDDYTRIEISVIDQKTKEQIPGITIQIRDKETGEIVIEYETTEEPQVIIGLPIGEYDIIQIQLPEDKGYITTNTTLEVEDTPEIQEKVIEQNITKVKLEVIDEELEEKVDKVEIYLIDKDTKDVIATTEEIEGKLKIEEREDGYYVEEVPIGEYILYQKVPEGYLEIELTEFTVEDIAEEQVHTSYTRKLVLDMQVEKEIVNIIVNGVKDAVGQDNQTPKIEIVASKLQTEQIEIEYKIRITNTGEIAGTIGKILENIPEKFVYESGKNTVNWEQEGENLICKDYENTEIGVGESIEIPITLKWVNSAENLGKKVNTVRLENVTNALGYTDETEENNAASVTTVMSIKTGNEAFYQNLKMISILVSVIGILAICIIIEIKYLRRKTK